MNKARVLLYGPGYDPRFIFTTVQYQIFFLSEPQYRLGNPANLPEIVEKYKIYDPPVSVWIKVYAFVAATHSNLLYEICLKLKTSFS